MNQTQPVRSTQPADVQAFLQLCNSLKGTLFETGAPLYINRCPGRLDLMGGNDDYSGGMVFEITIAEATFFAAQPRTDQRFVLQNPSVGSMGWQERIEFSMEDFSYGDSVRAIEEVRAWINQDPRHSWIATLVGNLYYLKKEHSQRVTHGLNHAARFEYSPWKRRQFVSSVGSGRYESLCCRLRYPNQRC